MAHIILVHGMFARGLSWFDIPVRLKAQGHEVDVITLPGHSGLPLTIDFRSGVDLNKYAAAVSARFRDNEPSILIGHSLGGMAISEAAADYPDKVAKLIYVAAALPQNRQSIGDAIGVNDLDDMLRLVEGAKSDFKMAGIGSDSPALGSQPLRPFWDRFNESADFGAIPRAYVKCLSDQVIPPDIQQAMIDARPGTSQHEIDTGHIPQKSKPDELTTALLAEIP